MKIIGAVFCILAISSIPGFGELPIVTKFILWIMFGGFGAWFGRMLKDFVDLD